MAHKGDYKVGAWPYTPEADGFDYQEAGEEETEVKRELKVPRHDPSVPPVSIHSGRLDEPEEESNFKP